MKINQAASDIGGRGCTACRYIPAETAAKRPCVLPCPEFSRAQDMPSIVASTKAFPGAGHVAIIFDYPTFERRLSPFVEEDR